MRLSSKGHLNNLSVGAINIACFICNRLYAKSSVEIETPLDLIHRRNPFFGHFLVSGCKAFVRMLTQKRKDKFDKRSKEGILVSDCKGDAYCMLLSSKLNIVDTKSVTLMNKFAQLTLDNIWDRSSLVFHT